LRLAAHFLLTPFGSLGDLHPYMAVGLGLRARGHDVTIATSEIYREKVLAEGLGFRPFRPDVSYMLHDPEAMRKAFHPRSGSEYIFRRILLPAVEQSYEDTLEAARDADLIVGHAAAFATPTVAEVLQKRWISVALQPMLLLSAHDPPMISGLPLAHRLVHYGPRFWNPALRLVRAVARRWAVPLTRLRRRLGLTELRNPVIDDMFSPYGTQAWFSRVLGTPQPDWPANVAITGFPFYDKLEAGQGMSEELRNFLDAGPPPVVFTLGSSAVMDAGAFYRESAAAARGLGIRAVLLIGRDARNRPASPEGGIFACEYVPYSELLPRAAATVHQGGVGTTAQALISGRPMIVVPWSHDQPDNGMRVARLGAGRMIPRSKYRAKRVTAELSALLGDRSYSDAAADLAARMRTEDGVAAACDGLEAALNSKRKW
jgi:rhamnosyltransferase subunit B